MTPPARPSRRRFRIGRSTPGARLALLLLALATTSAGPDPTANPAALQRPRYTHAQMEAAMPPGGRFRCVYGTRDPAATPILRALAVRLARRLSGGDSTLAIADRELDPSTSAGDALLLLGGPEANSWTARLAPGLPVRFAPHAFEWSGRRYDRPGDVLQLVYPDPLAPRRFLWLIAANTTAALTHDGGGLLLGDEDWRITRDGVLARSGRFADAPRPWSYDPALDRDRERERERFVAALVPAPVPGAHMVVRASADQAAWRAQVVTAGAGVAAQVAALGVRPAGREPVRVTLYASSLEKGVLTRDTRPEHLDETGEPQVAPLATGEPADLWSLGAALLRRAGGARESRFLEPAGVWCAHRFDGEPLAVAVSRLYFGRLLPRVRDAVARPVFWRSPRIVVPARALVFAACTEVAGPRASAVMPVLLAANPPGDLDSLCRAMRLDPARVERRYAELGDSLARAGQREARARAPRTWRPADGFQRGVWLSHTVSLEQGYLSPACARQLDALRAMGADWIALAPVGSVTPGNEPAIVPSAAGGIEGETDEAIVHAVALAHARGMKVWLAPQLVAPGWVGDLSYTPAGWTRFFAGYREYLLHCALLAEREHVEGLLVGHELASATATHPERWREMIAEVRRVYDGTIAYGASWGDEVRNVEFWDALDLIGVSAYAPLASAPTTDAKVLRAGAARELADLHAIATRWGRPVLLAEAGFPSAPDAAVRPWQEGRGEIDLESQRACAEALVQALDRETWVAGVCWFAWPSGERGGGPSDAGFTPRGKPAEAVLRRALTDWKGRPVMAPVMVPSAR